MRSERQTIEGIRQRVADVEWAHAWSGEGCMCGVRVERSGHAAHVDAEVARQVGARREDLKGLTKRDKDDTVRLHA